MRTKFGNINRSLKKIYLTLSYIFVAIFISISVAGIFVNSPMMNIQHNFIAPSSSIIKNILYLDSFNYDKIYGTESIPVRTDKNKYHLLGTDRDGKDIFQRLLSTSVNYLGPGISSALIAVLFGGLFGAFRGYSRNKILLSFWDLIFVIMESFPKILLVLLVSYSTNYNIWGIVFSVAFVNSMKISGVVQSGIEHFKNNQFIEAAEEIGASAFRIVFLHILWFNYRKNVFVQFIYAFSSFIIYECTLSYFNISTSLGVDTWGKMIVDGIGGRGGNILQHGILWTSLPPIIFILFLILSLNRIADYYSAAGK